MSERKPLVNSDPKLARRPSELTVDLAAYSDAYDAGMAAERKAIRLRALGCVTCGKVHEYRDGTFADPDDHHVYRPRFRHGMPGAAAELGALIGGDQ